MALLILMLIMVRPVRFGGQPQMYTVLQPLLRFAGHLSLISQEPTQCVLNHNNAESIFNEDFQRPRRGVTRPLSGGELFIYRTIPPPLGIT